MRKLEPNPGLSETVAKVRTTPTIGVDISKDKNTNRSVLNYAAPV